MKTIRLVLYSKVMAIATTLLEIKAVVMHRRTHEPTVILQDAPGLHMVPVPVGAAEAGALVIGIDHEGPLVPLPHDIIARLFATHRFTAQHVMLGIDAAGRLLSALRYRYRRRDYSIELRPGDALTLASRFSIPIFMPTEHLRSCATPGIPEELDVFSQDVLLLGPRSNS